MSSTGRGATRRSGTRGTAHRDTDKWCSGAERNNTEGKRNADGRGGRETVQGDRTKQYGVGRETLMEWEEEKRLSGKEERGRKGSKGKETERK